jgi:hypothetical protein
MKAERSVNNIIYPDVGQQISDLVSQQPEEAQQLRAPVPRKRLDQYSPVVSTAYSKLDPLLRKDFPPLSTFGFIPRPSEWQTGSAVFHNPRSSEELKTLAFQLGSETKLQEFADDLITDSEKDSLNAQHLMSAGFRGLVFPADMNSVEDPLTYVRERSLNSIDELRQKLFDPRTNGSEKGSALLQFRSKLDSLQKLAEFIDSSFADLDYLELSRVKAPILC